ncbi:hypothetical protein ACPDHQ_07375 [Myroides odoratimimus]|uniref:hypothetical protein n=1 Tax=Myroides odoratimimus TaxID=76832 RepID=UPI003D2F753A
MAYTQCNDIDKLCPENCDEQQLPEVNFDDCSPETNKSEIEWVVVGKSNAKAFKDIEDIEEWNTRLALPLKDSDSLRILRVSGDKPAAEDATMVISGQREVVTDGTHTLNYDIDETNKVNYEFVRRTNCGGTYRFWYITIGGLIYGGNCGLKGQMKARLVQERGDGAIEKYTGSLRWKDKFDPPRATWPLAGMTKFPTPSDTNP